MMGKMGDVVMSLPTVRSLVDKFDAEITLLTHPSCSQLIPVLRLCNVGISDYDILDYMYPPVDLAVFGATVASFDDSILSHLRPGYDKYINANLIFAPPCHISEFLMFKTGLSRSVFTTIHDFCVTTSLEPAPGETYIACHLGGGDKNRHIDFSKYLPDECRYVCVGGKNDPIGENMIDARGCSLVTSCRIMLGAKAVIGSDSLFTHLSGMLGIDTLCIHNSALSYLISNRRIYAKGKSLITS